MGDLILIVDDEADLREALIYGVEQAGFIVRQASCGLEALREAARNPRPNLILLDVMLPDLSGIEVCRQLRAKEELSSIPILMVTARGDEDDRVLGFEAGADDYVVKPFSTRELILRIRAVLRRQEPISATNEAFRTFGCLCIDLAAYRVFVSEQEVALTTLEFRLLRTLFERRGRVQSRETLLTDVWEVSANLTTRTVDTHVKRLREKIGPAGSFVETVRGVGYRFRNTP